MPQVAARAEAEVTHAVDRMRAWRADPVLFVRQVFGAEPDGWQADTLRAFHNAQRVAMVACKGPGKSTVLAWCAWNFLTTRPHPKIAATAITAPNLRDNLWAEMAKWQARSPLLSDLFEFSGTRISARQHAATWFMSARTWNRDASEEQQGSTLAGLHADYLLFILDEAGGIPDAVSRAAEGGLSTGIEAKIIIAGNPTHLTGPLFRAANTERPHWRVVEVTGDPDSPTRAPRVSIEWARSMIERYGRDSSLVQVDVLGKFPSGSTDALVSRDSFEAAFDRWGRRGELRAEPRQLGVDVARFGADRSVVCLRSGDAVERFIAWRGQDTIYTAGRVAEIAAEWVGADAAHAVAIAVDDVGVGGGVTDQLRERGYNVTGVNVGAGARLKSKHMNLRSELNQNLQDRFRVGLIAIEPTIRESTTLMAEGTTLRIGYGVGQKRKVERKEDYKRRTGRSPDFWDAMVLAFDDRASMPMVDFS